MSDAKLWIDEVGCTATITGVNVNYTMPLWAFEDMRDIIVANAEKKVEVTHRDFDIQQELLDRYRAENATLQASNEVIAEDHAALCEQNAKLRELAARAWRLFTENGAVHPSDLPEVDAVRDGLRVLGVEVE